VSFLHEIVTPVGEIEAGKDGREDDPRQHVDLLGPRRELVEPGNEQFDNDNIVRINLNVLCLFCKMI